MTDFQHPVILQGPHGLQIRVSYRIDQDMDLSHLGEFTSRTREPYWDRATETLWVGGESYGGDGQPCPEPAREVSQSWEQFHRGTHRYVETGNRETKALPAAQQGLAEGQAPYTDLDLRTWLIADVKRLERFNDSDLHGVRVLVELLDADGHSLDQVSLWGIESDAGEEEFQSAANELIEELLQRQRDNADARERANRYLKGEAKAQDFKPKVTDRYHKG